MTRHTEIDQQCINTLMTTLDNRLDDRAPAREGIGVRVTYKYRRRSRSAIVEPVIERSHQGVMVVCGADPAQQFPLRLIEGRPRLQCWKPSRPCLIERIIKTHTGDSQ